MTALIKSESCGKHRVTMEVKKTGLFVVTIAEHVGYNSVLETLMYHPIDSRAYHTEKQANRRYNTLLNNLRGGTAQ